MDRVFRVDFYPHEWLTLTGHMTPEQRGIFIQICSLIYANRKPIPDDPAHIARVSNCSTRAARSIISQLSAQGDITIHGGFITQKRCESELNKKRTHLESSANGGRTRAENAGENIKNKDLASSDATFSLTSSSPPYPIVSKKEESVKETLSGVSDVKPARKTSRKKGQEEYTPEFEEFWIEYPINNGTKAGAFEKYKTAIKQGVTHEIIIGGARAYTAFARARGTERKYIKHGATWLHQRGWEANYADDVPGTGRINGAHDKPGKSAQARAALDQAFDEMEGDGWFRQPGPERP